MSSETTTSPIQLREGQELLNKLGVAVNAYRVFSSKHPRFLEGCETFLEALRSYHENHPEQEQLLFVYREGKVFFRRMPLSLLTPPTIKRARLLGDRNVEGWRVTPRCSLTGLSNAIEMLTSADNDGSEACWRGINERLERDGLKPEVSFFTDREFNDWDEIQGVDTVEPTGDALSSSLLQLPSLSLPLELYQSTLTALHDLMSLLGTGGNPEFDDLLEVSHHVTRGIVDAEEAFLQLTNAQYEDEYTFNHSVNVCLLTMSALKPLVASEERLHRIGQAALLHDLGKSLVPGDLFYRRDALDTEEQHELERHPLLGAEILQDADDVDPLALVVAFDHHRRSDGSGYPRRARETELDPVTSIIAAADLYEALTAERPYKRSLSAAEAFQLLAKLPEAHGLESAVRLLFDVLSPFPPGTLVELDNGDRAVVTQVRRGLPDRPCVRRVESRGGDIVLEDDETDLAAQPDSSPTKLRIARGLPPEAVWLANDEPVPDRSRDAEIVDVYSRASSGTLFVSEG